MKGMVTGFLFGLLAISFIVLIGWLVRRDDDLSNRITILEITNRELKGGQKILMDWLRGPETPQPKP